MIIRPALFLFAAAAALSACTPAPEPMPMAPMETSPPVAVEPVPADPALPVALSARASLIPLGESGVGGELVFAVENGAVRVTGAFTGLKPGSTHAFHIHEFGNCTASDGSSAGGHFNPAGTEHGRVGTPTHHVGDSDNIAADGQGTATIDNRLEGATLGDGSSTDIIGKGVIVHAGVDDYTSQPTGDAGARLACGVIKAAK